MIDSDNCVKILDCTISDLKDDIRSISIKYLNKNIENVTRVIKLRETKRLRKISRGVYERQNLKPFGKALNGNNKPKIDQEMSLTIINKKEIKPKRPVNKLKEDNKKVYKPPSRCNNFTLDKIQI